MGLITKSVPDPFNRKIYTALGGVMLIVTAIIFLIFVKQPPPPRRPDRIIEEYDIKK